MTCADGVLRERIELLDPHDRHVGVVFALLAREEIDGDLAAAQHEPPHLRRLRCTASSITSLEPAFGQIGRGRCRHRMTEQALRRHHDERQRIGLQQQRLAAQHVKVLRRRRAVDDAHVGVGGGIQKALEPGARVVGPLAFVAVRQQQDQRRRQAPLGAARGQVLVEDDLRAVDEVAVLRFPHHEPARLLQVVAELEADAGVLRERAVADLERGLRLAQLLKRHVLVHR